jgi:hypothetical protein
MPCNTLPTVQLIGANGVRNGSMSFWSRLRIGPDGTRWVVCGAQPFTPTGGEDKTVLVSSDGGVTWRTEAQLNLDGVDVEIYPVSATDAWYTGLYADIYHTPTPTWWADCSPYLGADKAAKIFVPITGNAALYFAPHSTNGGGWTEYVTEDSGSTWSERSFTDVGF